jgi:hypothetical protein
MKNEFDSQRAATRSAVFVFSRALTSVVDEVHVDDEEPLTLTSENDGYLTTSPIVL